MIEYLADAFPDAALAGWTVPGWYFWDESASHCYGPFATRSEAEYEAQQYYASL